MRACAIAVFIAALCPSIAGASGLIGCYADASRSSPEIVATAPVLVEFQVVLQTADDVSAVWFRVSPDVEFQNHATYFGFDALGRATLGDVQTGITVDLGSCQTQTIHVGTVTYLLTSDIDCGMLYVDAAEGTPSGQIEAALCAGGVTYLSGSPGYLTSHPPYFPTRYPADGAAGIPLDVHVSWTESYCYVAGDCFGDCWYVDFGTDPGNLTAYPAMGGFDPGPLAANTTYYWRIESFPVGVSDVWSFTTADIVGAEASTWGKIKSLYR